MFKFFKSKSEPKSEVKNNEKVANTQTGEIKGKIVGVCACPAGIAHTYMAAESLEICGKQRGYKVKIETNGASGVENALTEEDIKSADYVIIASDTRIEMERFRGKKLIAVSVSDAIRKVTEVFEKLEKDEVNIY
jgi:fructose-specific phosphotransferase system IIB component